MTLTYKDPEGFNEENKVGPGSKWDGVENPVFVSDLELNLLDTYWYDTELDRSDNFSISVKPVPDPEKYGQMCVWEVEDNPYINISNYGSEYTYLPVPQEGKLGNLYYETYQTDTLKFTVNKILDYRKDFVYVINARVTFYDYGYNNFTKYFTINVGYTDVEKIIVEGFQDEYYNYGEMRFKSTKGNQIIVDLPYL